MYKFILNGSMVHAAAEMNLLEYLREEARLTSVKNGCAEGACGSCMVLVDGKAQRSCLLTVGKVNGKSVVTVEGLSAREKEIYSWAFAKAGAVQCGFCIPGMVISAKGLLDQQPSPSRKEIKHALRGNICRCTGYVKIEEAIMLASQALRGEIAPEQVNGEAGIGARMPRIDAREKVLGTGQYVDDLQVDNMLYGAVLRTRYPRARILSIDISAAKVHPGVMAVITAEDIPGIRYWGFLTKDWPALIATGEETRYIGDALALVAAVSKQAAKEAVGLIQVEYEELPPITMPTETLREDAPHIHPSGNILCTAQLRRGLVDEALAGAKYVVTRQYTSPPTEHAFLEPESALAIPGHDGTLTVYTGSQSVYEDQHGIAAILGLPAEKVRVIAKLIGGAFGGKEDLSVQHHAALLAYFAKKPVRLTLTRQESILVHPKRHAMEIEVTTACDEDGKLLAIRGEVLADNGAYASLGQPVLQRACTHLAGPYHIPHVDISGMAVYTNNPPAGAFRGFGVPQVVFAGESNLDLLAEMVGISPWEIRYRNVLEPGMVMPGGQLADEGTAIKETLLAVKDAYEAYPYTGIACAMKNTGIGVGVPDKAEVKIIIQEGTALVLTSAACIGQGLATVLTQIVSQTTGLPPGRIQIHTPDTAVTPDAGTTTASRQTLFTGEACRQAALRLAEALQNHALAELEGQTFEGEFLGETDPLDSPKAHPIYHVAYGYATQVAVLDETGKVIKIIAAHDVGRAINPLGVEGQIEGAVAMGLGYALTEDFPLVDGIPAVKFGTLGLFRSTDMPEIETIIVEKNPSPLAYGAKGVGEIAVIPTAPAIASAYYKLDGKERRSLPLQDTPYQKKR